MNYKNSRDVAWQLLIKHKISSLPVNLSKICKAEHIRLFSYKEGAKLIQKLQLEEHAVGNDAFSIGRVIFYNDENIVARQRFSIAHEMGHSIHSYFSNRTQPYAKADYRIFVAEVASTVNEVLLIRYLLNTEKDEKLKKYLLSYLLEMIRTTLFRQTQFAEFESIAHDLVEKGEPLTKENLSEKYLELNKKYYGKSVESDGNIRYEWARIPHFYRAFYVYKYATGIISALAIAERILTEGKSAVDDYFKFLSSGGSDGPVELLKIAGVDLTDKKAFLSAFKVFDDTLEEFIRMK